MANYSFGIKPIPDVENGHTFERDNFTQLLPHTPILTGKTGLRFVNCNLTNCDLPSGSYANKTPKQVSFCSHVQPRWVAHGLPVCAENCQHVIDTNEVIIDGVSLGVIYTYSNKGID